MKYTSLHELLKFSKAEEGDLFTLQRGSGPPLRYHLSHLTVMGLYGLNK